MLLTIRYSYTTPLKKVYISNTIHRQSDTNRFVYGLVIQANLVVLLFKYCGLILVTSDTETLVPPVMKLTYNIGTPVSCDHLCLAQ